MDHKLIAFASLLLLTLSTSANSSDWYNQHVQETESCAIKMLSLREISISDKEEIAGYIADSKAYRGAFQNEQMALVSYKFLDDADNKIGHAHPHKQ